METLEQFAAQHRLKTRKDDCGEPIIPGKFGHIFDGFNCGLGICILHTTPKKWGDIRRQLEAAGFVIRQNGDTEGTAIFNPGDYQQSKLALQAVRAKTRRIPSQAQLAVLAVARTARITSKTTQKVSTNTR